MSLESLQYQPLSQVLMVVPAPLYRQKYGLVEKGGQINSFHGSEEGLILRNVSSRISLRWPNYLLNSAVDKTKEAFNSSSNCNNTLAARKTISCKTTN